MVSMDEEEQRKRDGREPESKRAKTDGISFIILIIFARFLLFRCRQAFEVRQRRTFEG